MPGRKVRLFLTCTLEDAKTPGTYKTAAAVRLIRDLGINEEVVELGSVPYRALHLLYRSSDIYLTAAYAETFAHPLVEATACGLPVVASDIPVHREICPTAMFFERFSGEQLASRVLEVHAQRAPGGPRVQHSGLKFDWSEHVSELLAIAGKLKAPDSPFHEPGSKLEKAPWEAAS